MAYTIPTSADTPEQAILAVASAVKGEQVTGGDGSVNTALDILADALAGENVEVPMTQQGAILALAQYVGGGGGGVAKVTFACTYTGDAFGIVMPLVYEGVIYTGTSSDEVDGTTFDVPVAENGTQVVLEQPTPDDLTVTVTGDITIDDEGYLMVTGDGTVTLADKGDH